ncbi:hypothetical protein A3Q56_03616 [Intoshia linei]|uniref:3-hydroxyacyl-CoA dehydrogenase n=1 Tax=Intoshia linei TaxID=1819745 RepID=A0A177B2T9_9BILA|nr:hypothetical protein A3Q56_03616 [Intoshia linei]
MDSLDDLLNDLLDDKDSFYEAPQKLVEEQDEYGVIQKEHVKRKESNAQSKVINNQLSEISNELLSTVESPLSEPDSDLDAVDNEIENLDTMLKQININTNTLNKNKVICPGCNMEILGGYTIKAIDAIWHREHFVCVRCHTSLVGKIFFEKEESPYCETDYKLLFSPKCFKCNMPILEKVVKALGESWHPHHFTCFICSKVFGSEGFHEYENKPYCTLHYTELLAPKCAFCSKPIIDKYIVVINKTWHRECFKCWDCQAVFNNNLKYHEFEGDPYCKKHYDEKMSRMCHRCNGVIQGKFIEIADKVYHPEHFTKSINFAKFSQHKIVQFLHKPKFDKIRHVTVIGSGQMGHGITQCFIENSIKTHMIDIDKKILEKSILKIEKGILLKAAKMFKDDKNKISDYLTEKMKNITTSSKLTDDYTNEADLIIEATVENLKVKQDLFMQIDSIAKPDAIYATNTSSFLISAVFKNIDDKRKLNTCGIHFFNPAPIMKLVEIIQNNTDPVVFCKIDQLIKDIGKIAVYPKDKPGFIVNRLLIPFLVEAMHMLERGDATMEDIDKALKFGAGHPMGPINLADLIGLDVIKFILDGWIRDFPNDASFRKVELLDKMVNENKLGKKTKSGFYDY